MNYLKLFIIAIVIFVILDSLWLGFVAQPLYHKAYGPWLNLKAGQLAVRWWAAIIVYALFALAIVCMALPLANGALFSALCYGALLGLVTYGIYDFTCLAIFKDWPMAMAFLDWGWGIFICAVSTFLTAYADKLLSA